MSKITLPGHARVIHSRVVHRPAPVSPQEEALFFGWLSGHSWKITERSSGIRNWPRPGSCCDAAVPDMRDTLRLLPQVKVTCTQHPLALIIANSKNRPLEKWTIQAV